MKQKMKLQNASKKRTIAKRDNAAQDNATKATEQPDPRKPWREPAARAGECHKLPEREFRERLRRLQENSIFQKLKRLGVIRGSYRGEDFRRSGRELTEKEIEDVIEHKAGEIAGLKNDHNISEDDYNKFFYDVNEEDLNLDETAKRLNMSSEDTYILFSLSQEVKEYYEDIFASDSAWTGEQHDSLPHNYEEQAGNLDPEVDLPIAEITESGEIKCEAVGPTKKWIFNLRNSRERLKEVAELGLVSNEERKEAADILDEARLLNEVRTQQYQVLEVVARDSALYLESGRPEDIKIQKQKNVADETGIDTGRMSNISSKSVDTPLGPRTLSTFMANRRFVTKYIMKEIENENEEKIFNREMAEIIEKRLQDSPANSNVKISRQYVGSLRPKGENGGRNGDTYLEKFHKSRKIKKYVENIPEGQRRSLRKPEKEESSGEVYLTNYKPQKVIAHFIQSKNEPWPSARKLKELIKKELNFGIKERTIHKYMKKAGLRKTTKLDSTDPWSLINI